MTERKKNIIKISVSAVLLAAAYIITEYILNGLPFWANLLIFLPSYLVVGYEVLFEAAEKLFKGRVLAEDFLMSVATIGALIMGDFPEATFVMIFFLIGEVFEKTADRKSEEAIESLLQICADKATVLIDGKETEVDSKEVKIGDIVIVKVGEKIPIDGIIIEGKTEIDSAAITGESLPVFAEEGAKVYSATVNLSGVIKIKTTTTFDTSTASKIMELIEESTEKKAKTEKFITRFAKVYTPVVVILAVAFAIVPSIIFGDFRKYIYSALTFLVVSCPCALVVSVPISFFGAIGAASKKGILVKGSDALEVFSKIRAFAFDKTGTLTKGSFAVVAVHPEKIDKQELVKITASCEKYSTHPIALSIVSCLGDRPMYEVKNTKEISGRGIECVIDDNTILVGSEKLMNENGVNYKECHHSGTVVHIAVNGEYSGHIVISDSIKPSAKKTVEKLKKAKIKTVMLTGDNKETAKTVAEELGIDEYYSSLLPQKKVEIIEELIEKQKLVTAFSGDGINDAPVLARASIGVAMGALGSDAAINTADVVIMDDNLCKLPVLMKISKKAVRIAKENIAFSIGIKVGVLILSALSVPNIMWFASFADVGVLILAVFNSMRTMRG
ncbi:MAG: cadmium-translocating P-type ATPase [Clostridia bacterium]|nr:cadmium-translocating P-type ATPase [Clostridia bacterium]